MKELSHLEFVTKSSNILSLKFKYLVFILYNDQLWIVLILSVLVFM